MKVYGNELRSISLEYASMKKKKKKKKGEQKYGVESNTRNIAGKSAEKRGQP